MVSEPGCVCVSRMDRASGDQKWVKNVISMSGPSFDEVFKVSLRLDFSFHDVIFLQSNYIMNNLWLELSHLGWECVCICLPLKH